MPNAFVEMKGEKVHDDIMDDQAVFIELGDDRLVVVTGCCLAGSVNTLEQARKQFLKERPMRFRAVCI